MAKNTAPVKKAAKPAAKVETKAAKAKAEKITAITKKVNAAVDKVAAKKVTPKQAAAALAESIADIAKSNKAKKAATKVVKEEELNRRLTRAKSSLAAGVEAAMKQTPVAATTEQPQASYMTKPTTTAKKTGAVSFDSLTAGTEPAPVSKPVKPAGNKVSFDQLMAGVTPEAADTFDVLNFIKK